MFYLLFICSCLIVCSEIPFSESLCFIGTSQFISSLYDLTRFFLMWVFTELNFRTHLRGIFVLCVSFYKPVCAIISQPYDFLLLMFRVIKRVFIYLFLMLVSLTQWCEETVYFTTIHWHFLRFLPSIYYFHFHIGPYFVG